MAIIVKNGIKVGVQAPTPSSEPKPAVLKKRNIVEKKPEPMPEHVKPVLHSKFVIERKKTNGVASQDTILIVNGKQKSIGRKSHYLLDMLTLEDE
jgi:hypothetical protein